MRRSFAASALLLAALTTACGTQQHTATTAKLTDPNVIGTAVQKKLQESGSVHMNLTMTTQGAEPVKATMAMEYPDRIDLRIVGKSHALLAGESAYLEVAPGTKGVEPGKMWVKLPAETAAAFAQLSQASAQTADLAKSAKITSTSEDALGTHYAMSVDMEKVLGGDFLQKLVQQQTAGNEQAAAALKTALEQQLKGKTATLDMWLDKTGAPVKSVMDVAGVTKTEMTFAGWGEVRTIKAPSADEVSKS
ncbi:hypothetical protein ACIBG8_37440 [Nonomuraea sp. NPDC050556]|uniref:hypothetical protein n=1 Tax=Nonomuraea sp. NPDC050556 TaxID=3364369 RepID=UPI00379EDB56